MLGEEACSPPASSAFKQLRLQCVPQGGKQSPGSYRSGRTVPTFLSWREDVRGSGTGSAWRAVAFFKQEPRVSWVSRALPAGLNPDYCSLLVRSLARPGGSPRHGAAGSRSRPAPRGLTPPHALTAPQAAAVGGYLWFSRRIAPSLVRSPPGGVSPRAGTGASGIEPGEGRLEAPCVENAAQTTPPEAFRVTAKWGIPRVGCSSTLQPPHGRAGHGDGSV
ncbi:uncharacterized protein LOC121348926 [Pyrgilauda ruficollis]|uniref:uncharacterized protein LOC121348926 n=1 Tax=Pyrgilauda ruficollis TaxID=221976 RepID=UPI001B8639FE|nr:uncharacterized protein LOC121348926 [Pyrgilauda ruficollis]